MVYDLNFSPQVNQFFPEYNFVYPPSKNVNNIFLVIIENCIGSTESIYFLINNKLVCGYSQIFHHSQRRLCSPSFLFVLRVCIVTVMELFYNAIVRYPINRKISPKHWCIFL